MKKFFTLFLTLMTSVMLWAYDFQSGDLYYNITSNVAPYTVEVTSGIDYSGDITIPSSVTYNGITYAVTSIGWFYNCSSLTSVTIPNSVTSIGYQAFRGCSSLTSVTIPNSVTSIGNLAFAGCSSLTSVTIPNSVTSIGVNAFLACSSLTSITIPSSVTSIGSAAFSNCSSLTSITIPSSVTSIRSSAFYKCSSLTSVTIPNSVTSIGESAFYDCSSLTSVTIPNSVTSIGISAFSNCTSLTSVTIPNSVTSIGHHAFSHCSSLTSVTIPNSVTSIGSYAFKNCSSLTSVTIIPNSVTSIEVNAFEDTGIFNDNSNWENGVLYISNCLVAAKESLSGAYTIKDGTRIIANHAFDGCSSLTSVTIPSSVTSIGERAFYKCSSLTSITIPSSVTSIGSGTFYKCSSLTSVTIPNSVTSIGTGAFSYCSSLTSITIPSSVTSIGSAAFNKCSSLTSITIPSSVTSIGDGAFKNCSSLNTIYVEATTPPALKDSTFTRTPSPVCHIPCGTKAAYEASDWASQVSEFVEDCDYGSYSRTVRIGYNTICLPHGSSNFTGATFYEIAHILKNKKKIFFDEVKTLEAGKPYIFYPHSTEVTIYYDNTTSAIPLSHNGLHGTFDGITAASNFLKGKYLVAGNRMVLCGDGCSLAANRAYIVLDEISDKDHPAIPGIKRVSMDYSEENATTALDNITDESIVAPMQEGVYDILGRKVDAPTVSGFYIINGKKVFVAL